VNGDPHRTLPGFVDLQVNGYLGVEFSAADLTAEQCASVCRALLKTGTAAFLPTLITAPLEVYRHNLSILAEVNRQDEFHGRLLGIHVEGPFLSGEPGFIGAHPPEHVRSPDVSLLRQMQEWAAGQIRLLTIAAELPGAEELVETARELNIAVSIGHSDCSEQDLARLAKAGATAITHLGNGIPNELHRHVNPIWAGLAEKRMTAMVICDGHHLPDSVLRVVLKVKGVENTVVVSDLCPLAGLPAGEYTCFGSQVVLEPSGRVMLPARNCLAASGMPMLPAMNHLASLGILSHDELIAVGFDNPLRLIGAQPQDVCGESELMFDDQSRAFSLAAGKSD